MATSLGERPLAAAFSARSLAICVDASPPYRKKSLEFWSSWNEVDMDGSEPFEAFALTSFAAAASALAAASAAIDAGSAARFSPVTAPDLRILAMSAALPVSGAAVVGAEPPDDVADLDDVDATAGGVATAGAAFSIVTTVRGLGTAFGASERDPAVASACAPRCFDHTNNPMASGSAKGRRKMPAAPSSGAATARRTPMAGYSRTVFWSVDHANVAASARRRESSPPIVPSVPVRVVICLNRENILRPGSVLGRAAWHAWCLERNS